MELRRRYAKETRKKLSRFSQNNACHAKCNIKIWRKSCVNITKQVRYDVNLMINSVQSHVIVLAVHCLTSWQSWVYLSVFIIRHYASPVVVTRLSADPVILDETSPETELAHRVTCICLSLSNVLELIPHQCVAVVCKIMQDFFAQFDEFYLYVFHTRALHQAPCTYVHTYIHTYVSLKFASQPRDSFHGDNPERRIRAMRRIIPGNLR